MRRAKTVANDRRPFNNIGGARRKLVVGGTAIFLKQPIFLGKPRVILQPCSNDGGVLRRDDPQLSL